MPDFKNKLFPAVTLALLAAVLWFVAHRVAANLQAVDGVPSPNVALLLGACLLVWCSFTVRCIGYQVILRAHGHRVPLARTVGLIYVPLLGKYIPGKIWAIVSALHFYQHEGISKRVTLATISLAMPLSLLSALSVAAAFGTSFLAEQVGWIPALAATAALLAATCPKVFYALSNAGLRLFDRPLIEAKLSWPEVLRVLVLYILATSIMAVAFVLLAAAFYPVNVSNCPPMIAIFTFAQVAGFLAIFAPGGIGVREGILIVGLQPIIGPGPAIVVTGVARLWQTVLELIMAGIGWWMLRRSMLDSEEPETQASETRQLHTD